MSVQIGYRLTINGVSSDNPRQSSDEGGWESTANRHLSQTYPGSIGTRQLPQAIAGDSNELCNIYIILYNYLYYYNNLISMNKYTTII